MKTKRILSAVAALMLTAGFASAAPTAWNPSAGATTDFDYTNGQNANGKFGDPVVAGNTFLFFPVDFVAPAKNGVTATNNDTASFVAKSRGQNRLSRVSVGLSGDYAINDGITTLAGLTGTVEVLGTLKLTNVATNQVITQNLSFTPSQPVSGSGNGTFEGVALVNLPTNWSETLVELTGIINADASAGGTSLIQIKGASVDLQAAAVPLPPALLAAPAALAIGAFARRRMAKK